MTAAPPRLSEAAWQSRVVDYAQLRKWVVFHIRDARKLRMVGFPDLTLMRPGRLVFLELKSATGRLSAEQQQVRELLSSVDGVEYRVARPADWDELMGLLA